MENTIEKSDRPLTFHTFQMNIVSMESLQGRL